MRAPLRLIRLLLLTVLTTSLLCATAYGAGYAWQHRDSLPAFPRPSSAAHPAPDAEAPDATPEPTPVETPEPKPEPEPPFRLAPGDRGPDHRMADTRRNPEAANDRQDRILGRRPCRQRSGKLHRH